VRATLGLAEQWRATARAKAAVHPIATVRHTDVVARRTRDLEGRCPKASTNGSAARAEVLAIAAPAHPSSDRRFSALLTNGRAETTAGQCHLGLQGQGLCYFGDRMLGSLASGAA
jgi:hypothetical protein